MIFSTIASIAGLGLKAYSALKGADDAEDAAQANAELFNKEAEYQLWKAGVDLGRHRTEVDKLKGRQITGYSKAGVTPEGTPTDVLVDTEFQAAIDAELIKQDAERGAEIARLGGAAALDEGRDISTASKINAGATLLTELGRFQSRG